MATWVSKEAGRLQQPLYPNSRPFAAACCGNTAGAPPGPTATYTRPPGAPEFDCAPACKARLPAARAFAVSMPSHSRKSRRVVPVLWGRFGFCACALASASNRDAHCRYVRFLRRGHICALSAGVREPHLLKGVREHSRLLEQLAGCGPRSIFQRAASAKPRIIEPISHTYRTHMVHIIAYRVDRTPKRTLCGIQILAWG
jgi:hypothetical protein